MPAAFSSRGWPRHRPSYSLLCFSSYGCTVTAADKMQFIESKNLTEEMFQENPIINWDAITWVNRPVYLWTVQVVLAMISLTEALLLAYLGYKVRGPRLPRALLARASEGGLAVTWPLSQRSSGPMRIQRASRAAQRRATRRAIRSAGMNR